MAITRRTLDFLPSVFQTNTNSRFLTATMDQLVSEPLMTRMSSYVGRAEGSAVYQAGDPYIQEGDSFAQHYQLEPSLAVRNRKVTLDKEYRIDNVYNYLDMLNKISSDGGLNNNNDILFKQEYYNYQGFVDLDKLVNYGQYYWIPSGPPSIDVNTGGVPVEETFQVSVKGSDTTSFPGLTNQVTGAFGHVLSGFSSDINPTITLARGGVYKFVVNQPGYQFTIQTEPGDMDNAVKNVSWQQNISRFDVFGVSNNNTDAGTITFAVPKKNAQDEFVNMTEIASIDFVIDTPFNEVANANLANFVRRYQGFDGVKNIGDTIKLVVFTDTSDDNWVSPSLYDEGFDGNGYDLGTVPTKAQRKGIWQIKAEEGIINCSYVGEWAPNTKMQVREGNVYGNRWIYKDSTLSIKLVPVITADLDVLYYQSPQYGFGEIRIVDPVAGSVLNVGDILGSKNYTSPNGVRFTSGLKVKFTQLVEPAEYKDNEYIVENVGKAIKLVPMTNMITPEQFTISIGSGYDAASETYDYTNFEGTSSSPSNKDYIVINRSSTDGNPWSRGNRWFHKEVLNYTASILTPGIGFPFDDTNRAKRPIVEFIDDIKLFNGAKNFLGPVNLIDFGTEDALSLVEGQPYYYVDGVSLDNNVTVVFANDADPIIRKTIYKVEKIDINSFGKIQVHLVPRKQAVDGDSIVLTTGLKNQGVWYYWSDSSNSWVSAQQKLGINTEPYFDVFINDTSLSDKTAYPGSSFTGSKLFSYRRNASVAIDKELGFGLTYRSIGNIGDIVLDNNFDQDVFFYALNNVTTQLLVNIGNPLQKDSSGVYNPRNPWYPIADKSKQYIVESFTATLNRKNDFAIPLTFQTSTTENNVFLYLNGVLNTDYQLFVDNTNNLTLIHFANDLAVNDSVYLKIYGTPAVNKPVYTVPKNLERNSFNDVFSDITLGQMRDHLIEITNNALQFTGQPAGNNNLRDLDYLSSSGTILQHSAPFHTAQMLFNNPSTDIIKAIDYSRREYARFKEKFLTLLENTEFVDPTDSRAVVDRIMNDITNGADSSSPFFYTDMIASGKNYINTTYTVFNPAERNYNAVNSYDYTRADMFYQAVLVYINGNQLVHHQDYEISGRVITIQNSYTIAQDDVINIYEYANTRGCMVPATPSKLGIYPSYIPTIYSDDTIFNPFIDTANVIQGHDGSLTLAFGDFRDQALLELEKRIYNNIHIDWLNDNTLAYHQTVQPTAFRQTDYKFDEWTQLLSLGFLEWAGRNNVDIFTNTITSNDPFTYNYSQATDKLYNELMPGYWRGIYNYFYETDRPHTHPWEISGYTNKPVWWEIKYGPAPYTAGNLVMWGDLEAGIYYTDPAGTGVYNNPVVDPLYVKPGLTSIIPVDESGRLLPPIQVLVKQYDLLTASTKWRFGDQGPVETAWRRSSDYPYAVMTAYALARPAEFCNYTFNLLEYKKDANLNQVINITNNTRKIGYNVTGDAGQYIGTNIWLIDRIASLGLDVQDNFVNLMEDATLNLAYKLGGFTDKSYLQILAEQSSPASKNTGVLIPNENYNVVLTKSSPTSKDTYSAVIVEKVEQGYSVTGFDNYRPYFPIIPSLINSDNYSITVGNYSAIVYNQGQNNVLVVPYGTVFNSRQQLSDFLISYGRYLTAKGFQFIDTLEDQLTVKDWSLSVKEFLFFSQQGWDNSTVLSLTPSGSSIRFDNGVAVVDDISDSYNGSRILNSDGKLVNKRDYRVYRDGTSFQIKLNDSTKGIQLLDIETVQKEHTLLFDNTTVFNDVIYLPKIGNRQQRLKIIGRKTAGWDGTLFASGFLVNHRPVDVWSPYHDYFKGDLVSYKNKYYTAGAFLPGSSKFNQADWHEISADLLNKKLIPNPTFNASQFQQFYDVDKQDVNVSADMQARHATGFQPRQYFTDISLDTVSQHRFYLGMIAEKGTKAVIDKFLRAKLPYLNNDISITEEWAVKEGNYGNTEGKSQIELPLSKAKSINGSVIIELLNKNDSRDTRWNTFKSNDLYYIPPMYDKDIFTQTISKEQKIPTTGPVLLSEVSATVYDVNKIENIGLLVPVLGEGSRIWVAADLDDDWRVYRASGDYGQYVINANPISATEIEFTTTRAHGLAIRDKVMIKGAKISASTSAGGTINSNLDGVYRVTATDKGLRFRVTIPSNNNGQSSVPVAGPTKGGLFKLQPVRFKSRADFANFSPYKGWITGDIVYIDESTIGWQVLQNTASWTFQETHSPYSVTTNSNFGRAMAIDGTGRTVYVSSAEGTGTLYAYGLNEFNQWTEIQSLTAPNSGAVDFGYNLAVNDLNLIFSGSPDSNTNGSVYILKNDTGVIKFDQVIYDPTYNASSNFGQAIAASKDGNWLYISAPGSGSVDAYQLQQVDTQINTFTANGISGEFTMPLGARLISADPTQVKVYVNQKILVPFVDYTVDGTNVYVELTSIPNSGDSVVVEYSNYYVYIDSILNPASSNNFGNKLAVSKDGSQIIIGADTETYNNISHAGAVYVYNRTVENFVSDGVNSIYTTYFSPNSPTVTLDGTPYTNFSVMGSDVTLGDIPGASVIISIETNNFNLVQRIANPDPIAESTYGYSLILCPNNCSIYASAPKYLSQNGNPGRVYRHVNTGKIYGNITGTVQNPTVTAGHAIRLNGYQVEFTGTTLKNVIDDINSSYIPGVTASNVNGYLYISTDSQLVFNKLDITNDYGTALTDLGLVIYPSVQKIDPTYQEDGMTFGENLTISPDAMKLVISTTKGSGYKTITLDATATTIDGGATVFRDRISQSGSVYLYEYQPSASETITDIGKFTYATKFNTSDVKANDAFGLSTAISDNWVMICSPHASRLGVSKGLMYVFHNPKNDFVWKPIRNQNTKVDSDKLSRALIYNNKTEEIVSELPVVDGPFGKTLPFTVEGVNHVTDYDPAVYNSVPYAAGFAYDARNSWGKNQVGRIWWDTNAFKYMYWEQGDLINKSNYRDQIFPSGKINVYEWIESDMLPSQYNIAMSKMGVKSLYTAHEVYSQHIVNDMNGVPTIKNYFWVSYTADLNSAIATNINNITKALSDPRNTSIPYISVLDTNAVALYNCENLIGGDYVLRMEFNKSDTPMPIHNQWSIVKDDSRLGISEYAYNRLVDGMGAQDAQGRPVPDLKLPVRQRYGLDVRPRQTVFSDYNAARYFLWIFANDFLSTYPIRLIRSIDSFIKSDPYPDVTLYNDTVANELELGYLNVLNYAGKSVLVENDGAVGGGWTLRKLVGTEWQITKAQAYDLTQYWSYADWYAGGFDANTIPTYYVDFTADIANLALNNLDVVKILNSNAGGWQLVQVINGNLQLMGQENATIQFNTNFYNPVVAGQGLDGVGFEGTGFSRDNNLEVRLMFDALVQMLNKSSGAFVEQFRKLGVSLFDQGLTLISSQFKYTDWLMKTSFVSVNHTIRSLDQIPIYIKQPETVVQDYINEVKPYRSKIRRYTSIYPGSDSANLFSSDFDLPPYLAADGHYRSPQLENPNDAGQFLNYPYKSWLDNYGYQVYAIDIVNGGANYTNETVLTIISQPDAAGNQHGSGATAHVKVSQGGVITQVIVDIAGMGYLTNPIVMVEGTGSGAVLIARINNDLVRTSKNTLTFDRYTYDRTIQDWQPSHHYSVNDLFYYNYKPYRVIQAFTSSSTIDLTYVVEYRLYRWESRVKYSQYDIVIVDWANNIAYEVAQDHTSPGVLSDDYLNANFRSYNGVILDNASDRIWSHYKARLGQPGRNLAQLMTGIDYPGVKVQGPGFDFAPGFDNSTFDKVLFDTTPTSPEDDLGNVDTAYYSYFTDTSLGLRPEDILTDGGGFMDKYSSHAPEELVPGRVFDALDIKVTTTPGSDLLGTGFGPNIKLVGTLVQNFNSFPFSTDVIGSVEKLIVWTKDAGYKKENTDYIIDWLNRKITFTTLLNDPTDVVYVLTIGSTGEHILEKHSDTYGDGVTYSYPLPNQRISVAQQVYVKINGQETFDYTLQWDPTVIPAWTINTFYAQNDLFSYNGNVYQAKIDFTSGLIFDTITAKLFDYYAAVVFNTPPAAGDFIQIRSFNESSIRKAYSSVKEVNYTVAGTNGAVNYPDDYVFNLPELMQYIYPWDGFISVRLNGLELCPANNTYLTGNGTTHNFTLPLIGTTTAATISDNDIIVVVDKVTKLINVDYTIDRGDGSGNPIIQFVTAPAAGAQIILSDSSTADYRVQDSSTLRIKSLLNLTGQPTNLSIGDQINIIQYSNHDMYDMRTQVFKATLSTTPAPGGIDSGGWDSYGFDPNVIYVVSNPVYTLSRVCNNTSFLQVYVKGQLINPVYDYKIEDGTRIIISPRFTLGQNDVVHIRQFSEKLRAPTIRFRVFKDMNDNVQNLGIASKGTTTLARDLNFGDDTIYLTDTTGISEPGISSNQPGVLFIDGERITYWHKNDATNTITQIRRAAGGTGGKFHAAGTTVEDGSIGLSIPQGDKLWYGLVPGGSGGHVLTDGVRLQDANTVQAGYLRSISR